MLDKNTIKEVFLCKKNKLYLSINQYSYLVYFMLINNN